MEMIGFASGNISYYKKLLRMQMFTNRSFHRERLITEENANKRNLTSRHVLMFKRKVVYERR